MSNPSSPPPWNQPPASPYGGPPQGPAQAPAYLPNNGGPPAVPPLGGGGYGPPGYGPPGYGPQGFGSAGYGMGFGPPGYPPPAKSNAGLIIAVVIIVGVLGLFGLAGVGAYLAMRESSFDHTSVVVSDDGKSQVEVPTSWTPHPELNDKATIRVANPGREEYFIAINESKDDLDSKLTVDGYADLCMAGMKQQHDIRDLVFSAPTRLQIDGQPALQYDVSATVSSVKVQYILTFVAGAKQFHELMAWTLKSKFTSERALLVKATSTFKER